MLPGVIWASAENRVPPRSPPQCSHAAAGAARQSAKTNRQNLLFIACPGRVLGANYTALSSPSAKHFCQRFLPLVSQFIGCEERLIGLLHQCFSLEILHKCSYRVVRYLQ